MFIIEVLRFIPAILAGIHMITKARALQGLPHPRVYNPFEIWEYVRLTREKNGRIGTAFWVFIGSLAAAVLISFLE